MSLATYKRGRPGASGRLLKAISNDEQGIFGFFKSSSCRLFVLYFRYKI